ncbi:TetR/AcrR family transcriptional regulator [Cohnella suwonensis]|uniref:TetR/AcrR family transcriptional regulator n=1 Tax=Cohnella suwonensis TaxID=696072 RepID=A0ABW0LQX2_9BACL
MPKVVASREQWLQHGLETFARGGDESLVVEKMAAALGSSKSSFYWYFGNRDNFVRLIVETWRERATLQVIRTSEIERSADERLRSLLTAMFSATRLGDFLFFLRRLSLKEPEYVATLEELERSRVSFAGGLFEAIGYPKEEAERKAWLLYHYYLGWYERHKHEEQGEANVERHVRTVLSAWLG